MIIYEEIKKVDEVPWYEQPRFQFPLVASVDTCPQNFLGNLFFEEINDKKAPSTHQVIKGLSDSFKIQAKNPQMAKKQFEESWKAIFKIYAEDDSFSEPIDLENLATCLFLYCGPKLNFCELSAMRC